MYTRGEAEGGTQTVKKLRQKTIVKTMQNEGASIYFKYVQRREGGENEDDGTGEHTIAPHAKQSCKSVIASTLF